MVSTEVRRNLVEVTCKLLESSLFASSLSLNVGSPALTVARAPTASMAAPAALETKFVYERAAPLGTTSGAEYPNTALHAPKLEGVFGKVVPTGTINKAPKFLEQDFCYGKPKRPEVYSAQCTPASMGENRRSWQAYHAPF